MFSCLVILVINTVNMTFIPWRFRHLGGVLNTLFYSKMNRLYFSHLVERDVSENDITVVIGVKNRADYRLVNALSSIRNQSYPFERIYILVVEYGSSKNNVAIVSDICKTYKAEHLIVDNVSLWNRSHCLNIGIRHTTSKFILTSDTDIIFSENYIESAIQMLLKNPLSVVYSQTLDLTSQNCSILESVANRKCSIDCDSFLQYAEPRSQGDCNAGINATYRRYYEYIRGYDENYTLWGGEDNDIARRFSYLGLEPISICNVAYYLHQWHEKHEGVNSKILGSTINANELYFNKNHSVKRNPNGWGSYESI